MFISVGTFLINVKKVKEENMYEKFVKYKHNYRSGNGDQDLLNDVAFGKITYLPFKYGMISPYTNDGDSERADHRRKACLYHGKTVPHRAGRKNAPRSCYFLAGLGRARAKHLRIGGVCRSRDQRIDKGNGCISAGGI